MVLIQMNIDDDQDMEIKIYMARNKIIRKDIAISRIINIGLKNL